MRGLADPIRHRARSVDSVASALKSL